jgi:hypothetical protein
VLSGSPCSPLLRHQVRPREIFLHAFDLLELDWHGPAARTHRAAQGHAGEITGGGPGRVCEHLEHGGEIVFRHDGKLGCQGIVSKRLGSRTFPAARGTVSNSRIRPRRLCGSKQKMIGSDGRENAGRAELAANRAARFVVSLRRRAASARSVSDPRSGAPSSDMGPISLPRSRAGNAAATVGPCPR